MAHGRWVTLVGVLAAGVAAAMPPCEEDRGQTGLAVGPAASGLVVTMVDVHSVAATAGVRTGDEVLQLNGIVPRGCADYGRAVRDARRDRKALLVLVRRDGSDVAFVLGPATWDVAVTTPPPAIPTPAPSVEPLVTTPPPALPSGERVTLDGLLLALAGLAPDDDRPPRTASLDGYRRAIGRLREQIGSLRAGGTVGAQVAGGLATVLAYHEAAGVAWAADEIAAQRTRRPRQLPPTERVAPYFADSEAAAVLDRFPFLRDTIVREPGPGVFGTETAGAWRPLQARALLWQHARLELAQLSRWLAGEPP